jgi:murein DD-endopeptidase MepM/ murein hydrolase activator NlpD
MIGDLWHKGASRLPEIRSAFQVTSTAVELIRTQRAYALAASAAGVAIIAVAFAGVGYVRHTQNAAEAQASASRVESANIDLQDELAHLQDKIAASNRDLSAAQSRLAVLLDEEKTRAQQDQHQPTAAEPPASGKGDKVTQLTSALHTAEAQRATLAARLSKAEADLVEQQAKQAELQTQLEEWQKKLQQLTSDHDKAVGERDRLRARVDELEKQSQLRHAQQQQTVAAAQQPSAAPAVAPAPALVSAPAAAPAPPSAVAAPAPASAPVTAAANAPAEAPQRVVGILNAPPPAQLVVVAAAPQVAAAPPPAQPTVAAAAQVAAVPHGALDQFARVLASAGVDVRHLFSEYGVNRAEGGPFIPVSAGQAAPGLSTDRLAALRAMIKTLPVAAPLESFEVSSPFGVRGDPENGREGFHTGIDLTAPYDSPVYATAPGTVTFAGWRDDYGKIVEIDHGNGIATRYAHMHAFTVSVGQHVVAHQQVGYLGSTGRATGPHVHYEVVVNGEPQDPEKFFGLARYVPAITVPVAARN